MIGHSPAKCRKSVTLWFDTNGEEVEEVEIFYGIVAITRVMVKRRERRKTPWNCKCIGEGKVCAFFTFLPTFFYSCYFFRCLSLALVFLKKSCYKKKEEN